MNHSPWLTPWPAARQMAAGALCWALTGLPGLVWTPAWAQDARATLPDHKPLAMKSALDAAWQRSIESAEAQGRRTRAQAEQAVARSWLAAPAALTLSQRQGQSGTPDGSRETELGVSLPFWWPSQRSAGTLAAEAESRWAVLAEQAARLRLAGELREAAGAWRLAQNEQGMLDQQVLTLRQLVSDVDRRVKAGDLAPADAMAAKAELLALQSQAQAAHQALTAQQAQWRLVTGLAELPAPEGEVEDVQTLPDTHPELLWSQAAVELAQRRVDLIQARRTAAPELSVGLRQERPGQGAGTQQSVVVGLRMPFGGDTHQQPRLAAALADLDLARAQAQRSRERLQLEHQLAMAHLQLSRSQAEAEQERATLLRERARLIDKSFRAGESPLPELLRALNAATSAEASSARQQAALQLAMARLQQARGKLP